VVCGEGVGRVWGGCGKEKFGKLRVCIGEPLYLPRFLFELELILEKYVKIHGRVISRNRLATAMQSSFESAICQGELDYAKYLVHVNDNDIDIHANGDLAFRMACRLGQLSTAQWLVSLGGVNIRAMNDGAFWGSCVEGHLEIAKWLWALCKVGGHGVASIQVCVGPAFTVACARGHFGVARWLVSLGGVDIHFEYDQPFRTSCTYGHLEIARWLVSLHPEWRHWNLASLKTWESERDVWIRACACEV
jgi:hypothetical protein